MSWQYKAVPFSVLTQPGTPSPEAIARVTAELNELGAEGWEAFAFGEHHGIFYLKRPGGEGQT